MTLVPTDESKDTPKKYERLWNKIRNLIRSITNYSDNYDEKCMKIKFNSDDDYIWFSYIKKSLEVYNMI